MAELGKLPWPGKAEEKDLIVTELCEEMESCDDDFANCMAEYLCIYGYLVRFPPSGARGSKYFDKDENGNPSAEGIGARKRAHAICRQGKRPGLPPPDITACEKEREPLGKGDFASADYNDLERACKNRRTVEGSDEAAKSARRKHSSDAGMAAARGWAKEKYPGYDCAEGSGGSGDFDLVCFKKEGEKIVDVVIIEAKGGGSDLRDRYDVPNRTLPSGNNRRVEQGTPEYIDSILMQMRESGATFELLSGGTMSARDLALDIEETYYGYGGLSYYKVNADCGEEEDDARYSVTEFELDRKKRYKLCSRENAKCKCPPDLDDDSPLKDSRDGEGRWLAGTNDPPKRGEKNVYENPRTKPPRRPKRK